jgi:hypothetical protein
VVRFVESEHDSQGGAGAFVVTESVKARGEGEAGFLRRAGLAEQLAVEQRGILVVPLVTEGVGEVKDFGRRLPAPGR